MKQGRDTTKEERLGIVKDCLASGKNYGAMDAAIRDGRDRSIPDRKQPRLSGRGKTQGSNGVCSRKRESVINL